jgi:hypothetical protein
VHGFVDDSAGFQRCRYIEFLSQLHETFAANSHDPVNARASELLSYLGPWGHGVPKGSRNAWKHGGRSVSTIALRRKLREMLRLNGALISGEKWTSASWPA